MGPGSVTSLLHRSGQTGQTGELPWGKTMLPPRVTEGTRKVQSVKLQTQG